MRLDYRTAMAAAEDAGSRSMRAAGRKVWSQEDFDAASREFDRLIPYILPEPGMILIQQEEMA